MTRSERKANIVREALTMERHRLLQVGKKHAAAALSELLMSPDVSLTDIFNHIDDAANNRPVGGA